MAVFILFGCGLISVLLYILTYQRLRPKKNMLMKTISSTFFLAVGISAYYYNSDSLSYAQWVLLGLGCGFLGDIILAFKEIYPQHRHTFLIAGLLMFFVGHVFYLVALAKHLSYHTCYTLPLFYLLRS
jgi:uncharacterized membrane protein YhhN